MLYKQTDFYSTVLTVFYGKCERKAQWVILFGSIQPYFVDTENRDTTDKKKNETNRNHNKNRNQTAENGQRCIGENCKKFTLQENL